jgi:hypothetical protein
MTDTELNDFAKNGFHRPVNSSRSDAGWPDAPSSLASGQRNGHSVGSSSAASKEHSDWARDNLPSLSKCIRETEPRKVMCGFRVARASLLDTLGAVT